MLHSLEIRTTQTTELIDLTAAVQDLVSRHGPLDGVCFIYVPHTTAGITINEHADPAVRQDILMVLNSLIRTDAPYRHAEGNSPAHVKATLLGSTATVPIESGRLVLGTWQGIFFGEFDGPRRRQVKVKFLSG
ncbi:MAG: secondary thiamine-phosphate synthase enzyme YjbQ [Desulfobacca sp.]|uniref:secondary thiamine-phosphate synthase enzyme YjbQ n=1 Tax=Desulfobacca sp. TaxID=2067990 RepID=UPI00404A308A